MNLETHKGMVVGPVTADIIEQTVKDLTETGAAYIILNDDRDAETYVQAAGSVEEDFIIERRDGSAGEHYRGIRRVTALELVTLLVSCLRGDSQWRRHVSWAAVDVDSEH